MVIALIHVMAATTNHPIICKKRGCLYFCIIDCLFAAIRITAKAIGKIIPFTAPANINSLTGFPTITNIAVDKRIKQLITIFSLFLTAGINVFQKETDVNDAPITEVMAALHNTIPKNL